MADAAPPKKSGPGRWILLGCGALLGLMLLGFGGCAGIMYFVYKGTEPIAMIGADYLLRSPEMQTALGTNITITRHKTGWNVHTVNDRGNARITYTAKGSRADGETVVWLIKTAGQWSPIGARFSPGSGDAVEIGKPPKERLSIDWD
jgi:hypothetical protein